MLVSVIKCHKVTILVSKGLHSFMNGFLGTYQTSLDDKGRFNVPAKFRGVLEKDYSSQLVITYMDGYLIAFPQKEWARNKERLHDLDTTNKEDRKKIRRIVSKAVEVEIKSGKLLIPANQREIAEIAVQDEVVLVGMLESFEIWSKNRWLEEEQDDED